MTKPRQSLQARTLPELTEKMAAMGPEAVQAALEPENSSAVGEDGGESPEARQARARREEKELREACAPLFAPYWAAYLALLPLITAEVRAQWSRLPGTKRALDSVLAKAAQRLSAATAKVRAAARLAVESRSDIWTLAAEHAAKMAAAGPELSAAPCLAAESELRVEAGKEEALLRAASEEATTAVEAYEATVREATDLRAAFDQAKAEVEKATAPALSALDRVRKLKAVMQEAGERCFKAYEAAGYPVVGAYRSPWYNEKHVAERELGYDERRETISARRAIREYSAFLGVEAVD